MGGHVHRVAVGQRPNLIDSKATEAETGVAFRFVLLTLLAVDGVLSAVGGAFFLPSYVGTIPIPVSPLVSGLVNASMVWAAARWTSSPRVAALPLFSWLLAVLVMCLPGPGGDVIFAGRGVLEYSPLLLLALGLFPPFWVLWRRRPVP